MNTLLKLPPAPFAPWAEIVPGYGPVTVDILLTLPDDGYVYEVVEGVLVRMAGSGFDATTVGGEYLFRAALLRAAAPPWRCDTRRWGVQVPGRGDGITP